MKTFEGKLVSENVKVGIVLRQGLTNLSLLNS